ncbi:hypothetical protein EDD16DRAFT_21030 [Pisolithus croceorrhizus]|nr:hypothetical protein EDD16DRAFT_21030 [Pisolithus croceorrhizus]
MTNLGVVWYFAIVLAATRIPKTTMHICGFSAVHRRQASTLAVRKLPDIVTPKCCHIRSGITFRSSRGMGRNDDRIKSPVFAKSKRK